MRVRPRDARLAETLTVAITMVIVGALVDVDRGRAGRRRRHRRSTHDSPDPSVSPAPAIVAPSESAAPTPDPPRPPQARLHRPRPTAAPTRDPGDTHTWPRGPACRRPRRHRYPPRPPRRPRPRRRPRHPTPHRRRRIVPPRRAPDRRRAGAASLLSSLGPRHRARCRFRTATAATGLRRCRPGASTATSAPGRRSCCSATAMRSRWFPAVLRVAQGSRLATHQRHPVDVSAGRVLSYSRTTAPRSCAPACRGGAGRSCAWSRCGPRSSCCLARAGFVSATSTGQVLTGRARTDDWIRGMKWTLNRLEPRGRSRDPPGGHAQLALRESRPHASPAIRVTPCDARRP